MKVKLLKNQGKIKTKITDDKIINITGMIGAGKSTLSDNYRNGNYLIFNLDCLSNLDLERETQEMKEVKKIINAKFDNLNYKDNFKDYYKIIYEYIKINNKKAIIEGGHIFNYLKLENIKGTLVICLPSLIYCWYMSIKRHVIKYREKLKNKKITLVEYLKSNIKTVIKRTKQLKYYKKMNEFLKELNHYNSERIIAVDFDMEL